jgi:hypothetical protein
VRQRGSSDVTLARNIALSLALQAFELHPDRDVALMIDADMLFEPANAQQVISRARATGIATSAVYCTNAATLAAMRYDGRRAAHELAPTLPAEQGSLWLVGLGFLAIPKARLAELAKISEQFEWRDQPCYEFTWSSAQAGRWVSEDYRLCRRLGGVHLMRFAVGHIKAVPLYPDEETLRRLAAGEQLDGEMGKVKGSVSPDGGIEQK